LAKTLQYVFVMVLIIYSVKTFWNKLVFISFNRSLELLELISCRQNKPF